MKIVKVILLLLLITKSSIGFGNITMVIFGGGSCCSSEEIELVDSENSEEEEPKGCCDDGVCECLCCAHVFTVEEETILTNHLSPNHPVTLDNYSFPHHTSIAIGIWHPPRLI